MNETLYTKALIEKADNGEVTAIASTSTVDRQGEIIEVEGWDIKDFKKNPIILWGHDHSQLPLGTATKTWIDGTGKSAKLMIKIAFQEVTELGRAVKQLVSDGVLKTLSVGFQPIDGEGNTYTKQKLLEVSVVNVPANPDAMMLGYKSLKKAGFSDDTITQAGMPVAMIEKMEKLEQDVEIIKGQVNSAVKGLQQLNPHNGRNNQIVTERLSMSKMVAKAADNILGDKDTLPKQTVRNVKVIKRASELITVSLKGELSNGKNQRTTSQR